MHFEGCGGGHYQTDCQISIGSLAHVEYIDFVGNAIKGQGYIFNNTYNQGWMNHPNFEWGNQGQQNPIIPSRFQQPNQSDRIFDLEKVLEKIILSSHLRF